MAVDAEIVDLVEQCVLLMEANVAPQDLGGALAHMWPAVAAAISACGTALAGRPFMRYLGMGATMHAQAGLPVARALQGRGEIRAGTLPGGMATCLHLGPYEVIGASWGGIWAWLEARGQRRGFGGWDVYESVPDQVSDPAELRTWLFCPLAA